MEIFATLGVVALALLFVFIIQTLLALQSTLKKVDVVLLQLEIKLKKLNSFINTIENISDITEKETDQLKADYEYKKNNHNEKNLMESGELATWLISSLKLGINLFKGR